MQSSRCVKTINILFAKAGITIRFKSSFFHPRRGSSPFLVRHLLLMSRRLWRLWDFPFRTPERSNRPRHTGGSP
ncbi:unnamed protein product [Nesidiocoris tenuis]|uniref:Uncharacterized protein n=1 Tax=Nesidiocoris tenuis TaxID=355587 RepID=A0A6H5HS23_9HEMI|nr:unnamed protein product [Nesidiocoris tenuis]